ncbi:MAG: dephospho-CoA kinase [Betaproteobacteria bacterium]|nr:MAG: dephospho-CoA kinase [Betaproteobacteria bacterium]
MAYVVGMTGGIGSGKTEVAKAFSAVGIEIVDADVIAHRLSMPGQVGHAAIAAAFDSGVLLPSGELDRAELRRRAFADPRARARLEAALHPLIRRELYREMALWRGIYGVVVVPLLLERGGLAKEMDRVLVVDCSEDEQVRRVVARSGLAPAEVRAIMATQLDRLSRLRDADDVLDNSGSPDAIAPQVAQLDRRYKELASDRRRAM